MNSIREVNGTISEHQHLSAQVEHDGMDYEVIKEGLATIRNIRKPNRVTDGASPSDTIGSPQAVFYNPIQQFNRDLSVLAIRIYAEDLANIRNVRQERRTQVRADTGHRCKKRKRDESGHDANGQASQDGHNNQPEIGKDNEPVAGGRFDTATPGNASREVSNAALQSAPNGEALPSKTPPTSKAGHMSNAIDPDRVPPGSRPSRSDAKDNSNHITIIPVNKSFRVLDALSATGLRALRYAKEIPFVTSVTANDLSSSATASINLNVRLNELTDRVHTITGNALTHMYRVASEKDFALPDGHRGKYDVIDLDPYGTAAPFLDAAVQALYDGGLLCVTCTDSAVFASLGYAEKTFSQYGGLPFKGPQSHEAGLRLILHSLAMSAARYGIAIEPLLCLSIDFYARVFVRVRRSAAEVKFLAGKTMLVYNCDSGCGAWTTQFVANNKSAENKNGTLFFKHCVNQAPLASPKCEHCGFKTHLSGPMWGGPLHNPQFVQRMLDVLPSLCQKTYATKPRIEGMLYTALHETLLDTAPAQSSSSDQVAMSNTSVIARLDPSQPDRHPFYVIPSALAKVLHCVAPSAAAIRGALIGLGFRVTRSHTKPGSIRTDAPWDVIWEIMREWVRQKAPVKADAIKKGTAGWGIMQKDRTRSKLRELKKQLTSIIARVDDMETTKTEIEAALYRASRSSESNEVVADGKEPPEYSREDDLHLLEVIFDEDLGKEIEGKKLVRYQLNPRANWGPMTKAKGDHGGQTPAADMIEG